MSKRDRKSTRLNSSHQIISYAVFCLKKKNDSTEKGGCPLFTAKAYRQIHTARSPKKGLICTFCVSSINVSTGFIRPFFFFLMIRRPPRSTLFPYNDALPISDGFQRIHHRLRVQIKIGQVFSRLPVFFLQDVKGKAHHQLLKRDVVQ